MVQIFSSSRSVSSARGGGRRRSFLKSGAGDSGGYYSDGGGGSLAEPPGGAGAERRNSLGNSSGDMSVGSGFNVFAFPSRKKKKQQRQQALNAANQEWMEQRQLQLQRQQEQEQEAALQDGEVAFTTSPAVVGKDTEDLMLPKHKDLDADDDERFELSSPSSIDVDTASQDSLLQHCQTAMETLMAEITYHETLANKTFDLIPTHACCSMQVRKVLGSALVNQGPDWYDNHYNYDANANSSGITLAGLLDELEAIAQQTRQVACELFGAAHCELTNSGGHALARACQILLSSSSTTSSPNVPAGESAPLTTTTTGPTILVTGTVRHAERIRRQTRLWGGDYNVVTMPACWDVVTGTVNIDQLTMAMETHQPTLLVLGCGCDDTDAPALPQLTEYDLSAIRRLCHQQEQHDCRILHDISAVAGLVAGRVFQTDLLEYVDLAVVCHGQSLNAGDGDVGLVLSSQLQYRRLLEKEHSEPLSTNAPDQSTAVHVDNNQISCSRSSPQSLRFHEVAALCTAMLEFKAFGMEYAQQVVTNTQILAEKLVKRNINVVSPCTSTNSNDETCYSQSHELVIDLGPNGPKSSEAMQWLSAANIWVSAHEGSTDDRLLRLGTQVLTRRGFQPEDMSAVAKAVSDILRQRRETPPTRRYVQIKCANFPATLGFTFPSEANLTVPGMIALVRDYEFDDGISC